MENPQSATNTKTEKPKFFGTKNRKTDLKYSQNRKNQNPNAPLRQSTIYFIAIALWFMIRGSEAE